MAGPSREQEPISQTEPRIAYLTTVPFENRLYFEARNLSFPPNWRDNRDAIRQVQKEVLGGTNLYYLGVRESVDDKTGVLFEAQDLNGTNDHRVSRLNLFGHSMSGNPSQYILDQVVTIDSALKLFSIGAQVINAANGRNDCPYVEPFYAPGEYPYQRYAIRNLRYPEQAMNQSSLSSDEGVWENMEKMAASMAGRFGMELLDIYPDKKGMPEQINLLDPQEDISFAIGTKEGQNTYTHEGLCEPLRTPWQAFAALGAIAVCLNYGLDETQPDRSQASR